MDNRCNDKSPKRTSLHWCCGLDGSSDSECGIQNRIRSSASSASSNGIRYRRNNPLYTSHQPELFSSCKSPSSLSEWELPLPRCSSCTDMVRSDLCSNTALDLNRSSLLFCPLDISTVDARELEVSLMFLSVSSNGIDGCCGWVYREKWDLNFVRWVCWVWSTRLQPSSTSKSYVRNKATTPGCRNYHAFSLYFMVIPSYRRWGICIWTTVPPFIS